MSGPITAGYLLVHGTLALAARALAEARAIRGEYQEVLARVRAREEGLARQRAQQQGARLERIAALHRDAVREAARLDRLSALAASLGVPAAPPIPAPPATADDAALRGHLEALRAAAQALEAALDARNDAQAVALRESMAAGDHPASLDDVLAGYARQRAATAGLDPAQAERLKATAARILSRLQRGDDATLPAALEALARQIVMAPSVERAEALATELRAVVQRTNDAQAARARDATDARALLDALLQVEHADAPAGLVAALERVAAGVAPMDDGLREDAQALVEAAAADRERAEQAAAAYVLEQSLRDLGYEVEDIQSTLFADGGSVNFRRAGWDRYFVRLRVAPRERTVNFNVVRAKGDEESDARRHLDALAEDRWCAEFPALLRTLEARGLVLDVTRRLGAGEVPVQVVDPATVPAIASDDRPAPADATPRQRAR
jgi:hypothetical protein